MLEAGFYCISSLADPDSERLSTTAGDPDCHQDLPCPLLAIGDSLEALCSQGISKSFPRWLPRLQYLREWGKGGWAQPQALLHHRAAQPMGAEPADTEVPRLALPSVA